MFGIVWVYIATLGCSAKISSTAGSSYVLISGKIQPKPLQQADKHSWPLHTSRIFPVLLQDQEDFSKTLHRILEDFNRKNTRKGPYLAKLIYE